MPFTFNSFIFSCIFVSCKAENEVFSLKKVFSGNDSATELTVPPSPLGYCSVTIVSIPSICAVLASFAVFCATVSPLFAAFTNLSCISIIIKALDSIFNIFTSFNMHFFYTHPSTA